MLSIALLSTALLILAHATDFASCFMQKSIPRANLSPVGVTRNGTYVGYSLPQFSNEVFLGIPFAHAPRLQRAQSLNETWTGFRSATTYGTVCAGFGTNPRENWSPIGEDCLNLNIVRPTGTKVADKLPVLVWIYGGGWRQGTNRDPEFNTTWLVQTGVEIGVPTIVVSLNYRLSGFGFLSSKEVVDAGITNLAFRDLWKGLEWVRENIAGFGGDAGRVTIMGESGGATASAFLSMAYGGKNDGLFQGAILCSGGHFGLGTSDFVTQQALYDDTVKGVGCENATDTLQCLREAPFDMLNSTMYNNGAEGAGYYPIVDGDFMPSSPIRLWNSGRIAPINIIEGSNSDEGLSVVSVLIPTAANTTQELMQYVQAIMGLNETEAQGLLALYPWDAQQEPYNIPMDYPWQKTLLDAGYVTGNQTRRAYTIIGDVVFAAGRRKTVSDWPRFHGNRAWSYRFDTNPSAIPIVTTAGLGPGFAGHGAELSWTFRLPYKSPTPYPALPHVEAMQKEAYAMQACWLSFAAYGTPNRHGLDWVPHWPDYAGRNEGGVGRNMVFNATLSNTLNLHIEKDDYRIKGMEWFNARWETLYKIGFAQRTS